MKRTAAGLPELAMLLWRMLLCVLAISSLAVGQENPPLPYDGQWSLQFQMDTRPGGETIQMGQVTTSPFIVHLLAGKKFITVSPEGKITWESPDCGALRCEKFSTYPKGVSGHVTDDHRVMLRVSGSLLQQRKLNLNVQWSLGDGRVTTSASTGVQALLVYTVGGDGSTLTVTGPGPTYTAPLQYQGFTWTLAPETIEQQELSQDVIQEVATYRSARSGTYGGVVPVIERIEIKQVRHLNLVPRG